MSKRMCAIHPCSSSLQLCCGACCGAPADGASLRYLLDSVKMEESSTPLQEKWSAVNLPPEISSPRSD